jgi:hypothetical protein
MLSRLVYTYEGLGEASCHLRGNSIIVKFAPEHGMKDKSGVKVQLYSFFNLGSRWGWVVKATPRPLYPLERDPALTLHGLVGLRACVNGA